MKNTLFILIACAIGFIFALFIGGNKASSPISLGNSIDAAYSTTTDGTWNINNISTRNKVLKTGPGTLRNVVVTGATTATVLNFYDATTTSSHSDHATTTICYITASTPAGTYVCNASFVRGVVVEFPSALGAASSTITWQ